MYNYPPKQSDKLYYLDGLRGLMAINVILCHFVCVYYPQMYFDAHAKNDFLSLFATTPLSVLVNGNIAVAYFLALTGFLVGKSVFVAKSAGINTLAKKCVHRYTRLVPIIFLTTLATHLLMNLGLLYHLQIDDTQVNSSFLSSYCNFKPTLLTLLSNGLLRPFFNGSAYVGPFWTIKYEFLGYIMVLLMATALKNSRWRRLLYFFIALTTFKVADLYYSIMIMGLFIADLEFNQNFLFVQFSHHRAKKTGATIHGGSFFIFQFH